LFERCARNPDPKVWTQVCSEAHICTGKTCGQQSNCFFQQASKRLLAADVIVINHTLLFMLLARRSNRRNARRISLSECFTEYSLPEAILKFRQGVGRLIRTKSDSGIVVVLDNRIVTRPYGRAFLKALPNCPVKVI